MMKVGLIGCGNIAPKYLIGCAPFTDDIQVVACADLLVERAESFAQQYDLWALTIDELLANEDIDIVINLTIPAAHALVSLQIIEAGKHVYSEKPLALTREDGQKVMDAAKAAGVRVGCAPDTFLGAGGQTCRYLIDTGAIGEPVAAVAFMANHGPESWHPNPSFYYQPGGGPMFDMGPYYLTTLVNLLGPMKRISATTKTTLNERIAGHETIKGQRLPVTTTTHLAGTIDFAAGASATIITSFDVWKNNLPIIEIYGTEGTLSVPDPNTFRGTVQVWEHTTREWREVELMGNADAQRGIGVADMARAIANEQPHRASGDLAYHVLDAMAAFDESSQQDRHIYLSSTVEKPLPMVLENSGFQGD